MENLFKRRKNKAILGEILSHHASVDMYPLLLEDGFQFNSDLKLKSTKEKLLEKETDKKVVFRDMVKKTIIDGGKVLIPAFAIGRTQEIIYQLNDLVETGAIQDIPVFVDTPLGIKITELYEKHKECFDAETIKRLDHKDDPLDFHKLFGVEKHCDSIKLIDIKGPAIIIAGSGMCTGGRIINHLELLLEDNKTDVIFVGYQASNTLGTEILRYSKKENGYASINGNHVFIKASIHQISGFSAHADHDGLLNWIEGIEEKPHSIYLNHGGAFAQKELKKDLFKKLPNISVQCGFK